MSMRTNSCPCCGGSLLRHVRHGTVYWFCKTCWQEVPLLSVSPISNVEAGKRRAVPQPTKA
jgi:ribosomal protein L37AE/L43A